MNAKLNKIITVEVGDEDGSSMKLKQNTKYAFTKADI